MKIVADTNTFLAVALEEPEKPLIIELTLGHELLAPEVLPFEIGNALTAMMKKHNLEQDELVPAWDAFDRSRWNCVGLTFRLPCESPPVSTSMPTTPTSSDVP